MATKPTDFIERATSDFASGVDVASVPQNADPKDLLFGKTAPPPVEAEPTDDFWKWDEQKQEFFVEVDNNGRVERFSGKTRTEAAKNLAAGKKSLNQALAQQKEANRPRQPDMKLPFDPIQRKPTRTLTPQEIYALEEMRQTDPVRAQEIAFEARTGYTFDQVAQSVAVQEQTRQEVYAATVSGQFIGSHANDFYPSQGNMTLIDGWLKDRKLPVTRNNLEIAFLELQDKLQKPAEPVASAEEFTPPPPPVSPPARPAPGAPQAGGTALSREQVAAIQTGSLSEARDVIQNVFRANRGSR